MCSIRKDLVQAKNCRTQTPLQNYLGNTLGGDRILRELFSHPPPSKTLHRILEKSYSAHYVISCSPLRVKK